MQAWKQKYNTGDPGLLSSRNLLSDKNGTTAEFTSLSLSKYSHYNNVYSISQRAEDNIRLPLTFIQWQSVISSVFVLMHQFLFSYRLISSEIKVNEHLGEMVRWTLHSIQFFHLRGFKWERFIKIPFVGQSQADVEGCHGSRAESVIWRRRASICTTYWCMMGNSLFTDRLQSFFFFNKPLKKHLNRLIHWLINPLYFRNSLQWLVQHLRREGA